VNEPTRCNTDGVALPREYPAESCPIARSLEIVGERWTLLIMRDAFYGVRRFSDFRSHLGIPKAVLAERLAFLVEEGVLTKVTGSRGRDEYELTAKGLRLWPMIWSLISWGNENYLEKPSRRIYRHVECGGVIGQDRVCQRCAQLPDVGDLVAHPPRRPRDPSREDPVSKALRQPHRLLQPI
jgi:DNA-binding HxlR family transcriptional regulator